MMFTMIFIIGIFAWLTTKGDLPGGLRLAALGPEWHLLDGKFCSSGLDLLLHA